MRNSKTSKTKAETPERRILRATAAFYEFSKDALTSPARTHSLAWARHVAMYLTWRLYDMSNCDIAAYYNRKNHASVYHAIKTVKAKLAKSKRVRDEIAAITLAIK